MRIFRMPSFRLSLFIFLLCCALNAGENQTVDRQWCVIEAPQQANDGEKFTVKITIKDAPVGLKLNADMHWTNDNGGYGGFCKWGGQPKTVKKGDVVTLKYKMPERKDGKRGITLVYYLSAKGFNERDKKYAPASSSLIAINKDYINPDARPATVTFKKSWLIIGEPYKKGTAGSPWVEGDEITLPIEYYVDKEDDWGGTAIKVWVVGPWNDDNHGKYLAKRTHLNYRGMGGGVIPANKVKIGTPGKLEYQIKLVKPNTAQSPDKGKLGDGGIFIVFFQGKDGKKWPWEKRCGFGGWQRKDAFFELDAATPGNLFTYGQPVKMYAVIGNQGANGGAKNLKYTVSNTKGQDVANGSIAFTAGAQGQKVEIPLNLKERGTFMLHAEVDGWEARETTFARIPDLRKIIGDRPTPFGGQKFPGTSEAIKCARMLGMSACRVWTNWGNIEPAPGMINERHLAVLDRQFAALNAQHIRPWILFDGPAGWAIKNPKSFGLQFKPFPFADAELENVLNVVAKRYKNQISGFEWLNEICPGDVSADPVGDYLRFCKVGTETVKKINPGFSIQSAGGLWPLTYRKALLAAGLNKYVDIVSVHYSNSTSVNEARSHCAAVGEPGKTIWDNETAAVDSTWKMPLKEALQRTKQSNYFMNNFPGELLAGTPQICVFGGEPDPCGNWSHFWSDMSPRPSAATLAVLAAKLSFAKPLGEFILGKSTSCKLFADGKKAVMVVSSLEKGGETVALPCGAGKMLATDQQGNETALPVVGDIVKLHADDQAYFVEGGDLEVIEAQLAARITGSGSGIPQLSFIKGAADARIPLTLTNFYTRSLTCTLKLASEGAPGAAQPLKVTLKPGEIRPAVLKFAAEKTGAFPAAVEVTFNGGKLPRIVKPVQLNIIDPDSVGNQVKNPGFEEGQDGKAANWSGSGKTPAARRVAHNSPDELGHNGYVFQFSQCQKYTSIWQNLDNLAPGDYVYSAWIKAKNQPTGSNTTVTDVNGKRHDNMWLRVWVSPANQEHWDLFSCIVKQPKDANLKALSLAPVAKGPGESYMDNLQVSLYEGTEYNAFAPKAPGAIKIDGNLADFNRSHPIPLLGKTQLRTEGQGYKWTPSNLSGVAWFNWDTHNLYVGIEVLDDHAVARKNGDDANQDDSVEIAFHPLNRLAGEDSKAFRYILSAANPGGGSGKHTLFRPAKYSGGLKSGSLAKDSSLYEIAVKRDGNRTVYEVAMPWNELGGIVGSFGSKFGLSLALNDNDGAGRQATMLWGQGLRPWSPTALGMMVLTEK